MKPGGTRTGAHNQLFNCAMPATPQPDAWADEQTDQSSQTAAYYITDQSITGAWHSTGSGDTQPTNVIPISKIVRFSIMLSLHISSPFY